MASSDGGSSDHRKLALIIGNSDYNRPNNRLSHSAKNAIDLSALLNTINFDVVETHIDVKTDTELKEIVRKFANKIRDGDLVLFYFSGHSYQVEDENYLIPIGDDVIEADRDVPEFSMNVERTLQLLVEKNSSYVTIFILDCYGRYWLTSELPSDPMVKGKGLSTMSPRDGAFIQFICGANQTLTGVPTPDHKNLFTKNLLKYIDQENTDIIDVFRRIKADVYQESNKKRRPSIITGLYEHNQVFANKVIISSLIIPEDATWKSKARTIAGGRGLASTLDRLHCPQGLCVTHNQAIVIADSSNHRIMKYNQNAKIGERIAGKNISGYRSHLLAGPSDVIFHRQSKSYFICDYHNRRVLRWVRASGTRLETVIENIECFGLAMDDEGSLYVSDTEKHEVRRYQVGSRCVKVVAGGHGQGRRSHQLNHPTYLFVGSDQSVYVSDSYNDRVMKWKKGGKVGVVVAGGNGKGKTRAQLDCPAGLLVDQLGRIYVADHWNHRVMRWDNNATEGKVIVGNRYLPGDSAKHLNGPAGLAFDQDGNLYVADSYNHRIQRFTIQTNYYY